MTTLGNRQRKQFLTDHPEIAVPPARKQLNKKDGLALLPQVRETLQRLVSVPEIDVEFRMGTFHVTWAWTPPAHLFSDRGRPNTTVIRRDQELAREKVRDKVRKQLKKHGLDYIKTQVESPHAYGLFYQEPQPLLSLADGSAYLLEKHGVAVSAGTLKIQAQSGRLAAIKPGTDWLTTTAELDRYAAVSAGRPGNPNFKKSGE